MWETDSITLRGYLMCFLNFTQVVLENRGGNIYPSGDSERAHLHHGPPGSEHTVHHLHRGRVQERRESAIGNANRLDGPSVSGVRRGLYT